MAKQTKYQKQVDQLASNIVNKMYEMFQDPVNCGPNFTWENFPQMMKDLAQGYTPATFHTLSGQKLKTAEHDVGELAFKLAQDKAAHLVVKTTAKE